MKNSVRRNSSLAALVVLAVVVAGCSFINDWRTPLSPNYDAPTGTAAKEIAGGKVLFEAKCMKCHGENARGTWRMPSLVSKTYGQKNFKDRSFYVAVINGARSRSWLNFKNMQPFKDLSRADIRSILRYVRDLQKQRAIF